MTVASHRRPSGAPRADQQRAVVPRVTHPPTTGDEVLVVVVGCHGGAGATTLARLLYPAMDMALVRDWGRPHLHRWPTVLVTRGTASTVHAAVGMVAAAHAGGIRPAALVVVGDGPWPTPRVVTARLRLLGGRVGRVVHLPYVTRWRYLDDPLAAPIPPKVVAAAAEIRAAVNSTEEE